MKDHVDRYALPGQEQRKPAGRGQVFERKKQTQMSEGEKVLVAFLEKAADSIRYISSHVKKEHFISQVRKQLGELTEIFNVCLQQTGSLFHT